MLEEIEGTWEEVAAHAGDFAGRRVRLTVLSKEAPTSPVPETANGTAVPAGAVGALSGTSLPRVGTQPIQDLDKFLADLPHFGQEEVEALVGHLS